MSLIRILLARRELRTIRCTDALADVAADLTS
jgi:hypothetical protein